MIQAGAKVSFPNLDPIFHNVFSLSGAKTFDLGNYPKGDTRMVIFPEPGIVYVNCHLHPNMTATIVVDAKQWNTKADRDGHFVLPDVPPGKYTVVAWHKAAGFFRQQVDVGRVGNHNSRVFDSARRKRTQNQIGRAQRRRSTRREIRECVSGPAFSCSASCHSHFFSREVSWRSRSSLRVTVKNGLRSSLLENHRSIARLRSRTDLQNSRFLSVVGENAYLKAGLQLLSCQPR